MYFYSHLDKLKTYKILLSPFSLVFLDGKL